MAQAPNAIQRIKELDQERGRLLSDAKKEALERARTAVADLNSLGFAYSLTEAGAKKGTTRAKVPAKTTRKGTRGVKAAPCPVCEFETSPPHDARKHRSQGKRKFPFSAKHLEEMGLKRV